jgi:hypothetical protein
VSTEKSVHLHKVRVQGSPRGCVVGQEASVASGAHRFNVSGMRYQERHKRGSDTKERMSGRRTSLRRCTDRTSL